jgi:hypothetical protein
MIEPKDITGVDAVFPTTIEGFLPAMKDIPKEFKENGADNKWLKLFNQMFFCGGKFGKITAKPGIDAQKAFRHIRYCMGSFEPQHERKEAGCAYLMSLWFEDIEFQPKPFKP